MTHPKAGIGAVVFYDNKVLLVKRRNPPCQNEWAIPGGKIKTGESLQQAAEREILEETGVSIKAGDAIYAFDLIEKDINGNVTYHYIIVDVAATYISGDIKANSDASDAGWFSPESLTALPVNQETKTLLSRFHVFQH